VWETPRIPIEYKVFKGKYFGSTFLKKYKKYNGTYYLWFGSNLVLQILHLWIPIELAHLSRKTFQIEFWFGKNQVLPKQLSGGKKKNKKKINNFCWDFFLAQKFGEMFGQMGFN